MVENEFEVLDEKKDTGITKEKFKALPKEDKERLIDFQKAKAKDEGVDIQIKDDEIILGEHEKDLQEEAEKLGNCFFKDKNGKMKVNIDNFVNYMLSKFAFKTIFGKRYETIYFYDDGIYNTKGDEIIKTFSEEKLGQHCKNYSIKEIIGKIKRKTAIDFEEFEKTSINLIPLQNGVYNIELDMLEDYKPDIYFKFKLPISYDGKKDCPTFKKFVEETLYPEDINLVQEWFGFCLYRKYWLKKGMIWFGDTDTAKTTMLNFLEGIIGINNCSGLSLQKISGGNDFDLSNMHNKSLNSHDDLSSADINDGGGFKIATGGGSITGEIKFGDKFKFKNHSKLLFACNKIPSPKEINDPAYFTRWLPVAYDNQIKEEDQDPDFAEDCLEKESSGILNWALIGLKRLLENKRFSFNKSHEEVKAIMCRAGNPINAFVQDECREQEGFFISKQDLYDEYCKYMAKEKLQKMTKRMFGNNIIRHCTYIIDGWSGKESHIRGWRNLRVGDYKYEKIA